MHRLRAHPRVFLAPSPPLPPSHCSVYRRRHCGYSLRLSRSLSLFFLSIYTNSLSPPLRLCVIYIADKSVQEGSGNFVSGMLRFALSLPLARFDRSRKCICHECVYSRGAAASLPPPAHALLLYLRLELRVEGRFNLRLPHC